MSNSLIRPNIQSSRSNNQYYYQKLGDIHQDEEESPKNNSQYTSSNNNKLLNKTNHTQTKKEATDLTSPTKQKLSLEPMQSFQQSKKGSSSSELFTNERKNREFHELFIKLPLEDELISDFICALNKGTLHQGRVYLSNKSINFYSNILGWINKITIEYKNVVEISKQYTMGFIPNAILVRTDLGEKYVFTSFVYRELAYELLINQWRICLSGDTHLNQIPRITIPSQKKTTPESSAISSKEQSPVTSPKSKEEKIVKETQSFQNNGYNIIFEKTVVEKFDVILHELCDENFYRNLLNKENCKDVEVGRFTEKENVTQRTSSYKKGVSADILNTKCIVYLSINVLETLTKNLNSFEIIKRYSLDNTPISEYIYKVHNMCESCLINVKTREFSACCHSTTKKMCKLCAAIKTIKQHSVNYVKEKDAKSTSKNEEPALCSVENIEISFKKLDYKIRYQAIFQTLKSYLRSIETTKLLKYTGIVVVVIVLLLANMYTKNHLKRLQDTSEKLL